MSKRVAILTVKFDIRNSKKQKIISNSAKYFQQSTNISKKKLIFTGFFKKSSMEKEIKNLNRI